MEKKLLLEIENGDINKVRELLENGADVNSKNENGITALMIAINIGDIYLVRVLLENGANVNLVDSNGYNALIYACGKNEINIVKLLLETVVDVDTIATNGMTALKVACYQGNINIVKLLVEVSNIDIKDTKIGFTALMMASAKDDKDIVELLVEKGADKTIQNSYGMTAYDMASTNEIKRLLSYGTSWKGFRKEFLENMDNVLGEDGVNWSFCPVCLEYVRREDGCMYMSHNCKSKGKYYNENLYYKYKTGAGTITWCTICNRICANVRGEHGNIHKHYELGDVNDPEPDYAPLNIVANVFFQDDCRPNNGGGGPPEKLARFRKLREHILNLQDMVGKISYEHAMTELVEEMWNAPLAHNKEIIDKIEQDKKWNIPLEAFKFREDEDVVGVARNVRRPEADRNLKPEMHGKGMNFMGEEGSLIEFKHRQPDGSINKHEGGLITKETLKDWLTGIVKEFGLEKFGHCYMYPGACKARMYPEELKGLVPKELYEEYKRKFNDKFGRVAEGGTRKKKHTMKGGTRLKNRMTRKTKTPYAPGIFEPAKDAVCYLPRRTTRKSRKN